ncbi:MAG: hypothetical protein ACRDRM_11345 [Pseudonocardiaceae bacterium]
MSSVMLTEVEFRFKHGWCDLYLATDEAVHSFRATGMVDFFGDLVSAVCDLAGGRHSTSAMWADEPGGVFIDLAISAPKSLCGLAVHQFAEADWISNRSVWSPTRGTVVLDIVEPADNLLRHFADAFRMVQVLDVDTTGFMPSWGWHFPASSFDRLLRSGRQFGYKPKATKEIIRGSDRSES